MQRACTRRLQEFAEQYPSVECLYVLDEAGAHWVRVSGTVEARLAQMPTAAQGHRGVAGAAA